MMGAGQSQADVPPVPAEVTGRGPTLRAPPVPSPARSSPTVHWPEATARSHPPAMQRPLAIVPSAIHTAFMRPSSSTTEAAGARQRWPAVGPICNGHVIAPSPCARVRGAGRSVLAVRLGGAGAQTGPIPLLAVGDGSNALMRAIADAYPASACCFWGKRDKGARAIETHGPSALLFRRRTITAD